MRVALLVGLLACVLLDAVVAPAHGTLPWHRLPGFECLCGLVGCLLIVVASKALGKHLLQRPEDYYDD